MQTKPHIAHFDAYPAEASPGPVPARNPERTAHDILYEFAENDEATQAALAEVFRLQGIGCGLEREALAVFKANEGVTLVKVDGDTRKSQFRDYVVRFNPTGPGPSVTSCREGSIPASADLVAPFLDREPDGEDDTEL